MQEIFCESPEIRENFRHVKICCYTVHEGYDANVLLIYLAKESLVGLPLTGSMDDIKASLLTFVPVAS